MTVNKLSASNKSSMQVRIITAIVMLGVSLPCGILGNWFYFVMIAFLAVVATHEILCVPGSRKYSVFVKAIAYIFTLSFIFWGLFKSWFLNPNIESPLANGRFVMTGMFASVMAIIIFALVLFFIAILTPRVQLGDVTYIFTMCLIVGLGFLAMYFVRYYPNSDGIFENTTQISVDWGSITTTSAATYFKDYYTSHLGAGAQTFASVSTIIYVAFATWMSDVGAYFVGMLFGKHRMNPRISPHKTWEGFFGGVVFSFVTTIGVAALFEFVFKIPVVPGLLQLSYSPLLDSLGVFGGQAWVIFGLLTLVLPFTGNVGGFLFSLVKRQFGIKDYGKLFPGHGGVIDRFDSVLINSVVVTIILLNTANGWSFSV